MNRFPLTPLLIVGVASGLSGYWLGHRLEETAGMKPGARIAEILSGGPQPGGMNTRTAGVAESLVSPALKKLLGESALSDSTIQGVTSHVLEESNPARRAAAIGLILESMTPSNAASIRQAFIDSTIQTGRRHDTEWFLMIRKLGETLGEAALDQIGNSPAEAATAMEGWAMASPEAAMAYLEGRDPSEKGYAWKRSSVLSGIAQKDPAKGFQLALAQPDVPLDAGSLIKSAVQSVGIDGATAALQKVLDSAGPEVAENPAFLRIFQGLTEDMFHQNWTAGHSEKMLPWLEQQKGEPYLNDDIISHAAMDVVMQGKVTQALDWMDRMNDDDPSGTLGSKGLRSAVMRDPSLLAKLDETTFGRVISQFPPHSSAMSYLANALEASNPAYAKQLRAKGPE